MNKIIYNTYQPDKSFTFKTRDLFPTVKKLNPIMRLIKGQPLKKTMAWLNMVNRRGLSDISKDLQSYINTMLRNNLISESEINSMHIAYCSLEKSYKKRGKIMRKGRGVAFYCKLHFTKIKITIKLKKD